MSEKIERTIVKYLMERDELDDEQRADLATAAKARPSAYAPYSNFFWLGRRSGLKMERFIADGMWKQLSMMVPMLKPARFAG